MIRLKDRVLCIPRWDHGIHDINMDPGDKEFAAITGRSGSEKSTLTRLISGLLLPTADSAEVDGCLNSVSRQHRQVRKSPGMLLPSPHNQRIAAAREDVAFEPENLGLPTPEI